MVVANMVLKCKCGHYMISDENAGQDNCIECGEINVWG